MGKLVILKDYVDKRLARAISKKEHYKKDLGENPIQNDNLTYEHGFDYGYWLGRQSAFEDIVEKINEVENIRIELLEED